MFKHLSKINSHQDLKHIDRSDLPALCGELRTYIIDTVLKNGGHFAANLGVIELTVALHYQLSLPKDILVWDVGHQSYAHKVLTGRREQLSEIRKTGGISGFPSISESEFDAFGTGHSSTSISAVLGIAQANQLNDVDAQHVAVIGDGALTAGQAFEALNHVVELGLNILVIINDNQMSIDANNGNFAKILNSQNKARVFFETMGFQYSYCPNGNEFEMIDQSLKEMLKVKGPRILHTKTAKGFGYNPAEEDRIRWHATESMVKVLPNRKVENQNPKYQEVAGETLVELASQDKEVIVVTPAMPTGSGLKEFERQFPDRFFDVGIAEQHAVTFSAGMVKQGKKVFCFIYSTFLQRAYDQLIHDVCLQNLPVVFCIDRAGLVGGDGATHHGLFDLAYLQPIPNLKIYAPGSLTEFRQTLQLATRQTHASPMAIRYPRGRGHQLVHKSDDELVPFVYEENSNSKKLVISIGGAKPQVIEAIGKISESKRPNWIHLIQVKPLPINQLNSCLHGIKEVLTIEDGIIKGGVGQQISYSVEHENIEFNHLGINDVFVEHGATEDLKSQHGINSESILEWILD